MYIYTKAKSCNEGTRDGKAFQERGPISVFPCGEMKFFALETLTVNFSETSLTRFRDDSLSLPPPTPTSLRNRLVWFGLYQVMSLTAVKFVKLKTTVMT